MQVVWHIGLEVLRRRRSLSLGNKMRVGLLACLLFALWSMARSFHPTEALSRSFRSSSYPEFWLEDVVPNEAEDASSSVSRTTDSAAFCWRRDHGSWLRWLLQAPLGRGCGGRQDQV